MVKWKRLCLAALAQKRITSRWVDTSYFKYKSRYKQTHLQILNKTFKIKQFKPEQWQVISAIINDKRDTFIIAGTGFGKSLIYQFPPVFMKRIAIIISPLISLMDDQVLALRSKGIRAYLLTPKAREQWVDLTHYQIIYMTPELFDGLKGRSKLNEIKERICLVAIDECHCVTQWGVDFRKTFRKLSSIKTFLTGVPIVCLTATATDYCQQDVSKTLGLENPLVVRAELDRPNLEFTVIRQDVSFITAVKKYLPKNGTVIIYVLRRKEADRFSDELRREGFESQPYHAGMKAKNRHSVSQSFADGTTRIVVATIAFGMGIDRADVRVVIHYGSPKNLESYYQEAGRAGRDGLPSKCIIFWNPRDFQFHRQWLTVRRDRIPPEYLQHCENLVKEMENFLISTKCRRVEILRYFNFSMPELPIHEACCDNCTSNLHALVPPHQMYMNIDKHGLLDLSDDARTILRLVKAYKGRCNQKISLKLLMGERPSTFNQNHPPELFAKGKSKPKAWWSMVLYSLLEKRMIKKHIEFKTYRWCLL